MTYTEQIFKLGCPFNNEYQGTAKRLLFVCSAGMLRSPTCANVGASLGFNTRACGSHTEYALIPLSVNLIKWAYKIIFVNEENYFKALEVFAPVAYDLDIKAKAIVWDIEDDYEWGHPALVKYARDKLLSIS